MNEASREIWEDLGFNVMPCKDCGTETLVQRDLDTATCSQCRV